MTKKTFLAAVFLVLAACGGGGGGDDSGDDSGGDDTGGGGTTCAEVLDCAGACETDACADRCIEDGSPEAQELIVDLANCITESGCTDAACLESECGDEINACYE